MSHKSNFCNITNATLGNTCNSRNNQSNNCHMVEHTMFQDVPFDWLSPLAQESPKGTMTMLLCYCDDNGTMDWIERMWWETFILYRFIALMYQKRMIITQRVLVCLCWWPLSKEMQHHIMIVMVYWCRYTLTYDNLWVCMMLLSQCIAMVHRMY